MQMRFCELWRKLKLLAIPPLRFTAEGPDLNTETKIIAVEFAIRPPGMDEVELEMFPCKHTIMKVPYVYHQVRFTMHTSSGDVSVLQNVRFN